MKYYLIAPSVEEDEVGEYPQTTGTYPGYNRNAPNSMENLTSDCFPNFIPDLRFIIEDNAILTDVVSPSNLDFATGLLMNARTREIFSKAKIIPHQFYLATLKTNTQILDYYWLHLISPTLSIIDFEKSVFLETLPTQEKIIRTFNSYSEYDRYYESYDLNPLTIDKLSLKVNLKVDVFCLPGIFHDILVAEHICLLLQQKKITGLSYKEQNFYSA
ncbi:MAG: hypothetical protein J0G98_18300 [Terrimonas ferruginea]|uniref:hypothetical protein n=1 Tax=Terrimonas ferruginea TaxID=249 RepID=UPI00086F77DC|nr:hypothetical protein [Terrimonas ferruginea]MBN8785017.1 hypothetical protein [Terrimonas ferruginea]ODT49085.1 MAG: hypothetical protein ABS68_14215 [Niastella sp. SCN 39-18]OJW42023.1 MAG: hypothetical protein BGO56_05070 [Sphingobacteriales bacterium 48-107]